MCIHTHTHIWGTKYKKGTQKKFSFSPHSPKVCWSSWPNQFLSCLLAPHKPVKSRMPMHASPDKKLSKVVGKKKYHGSDSSLIRRSHHLAVRRLHWIKALMRMVHANYVCRNPVVFPHTQHTAKRKGKHSTKTDNKMSWRRAVHQRSCC